MKKFVRLLSLLMVLLLAVCVFVACNDTPDGGKTPDGGGTTPDGGDGGDDDVDTTQKFTATFKFVAPDGTELEADVERRNIAYNEEARQPNGYLNNVTKFEDYVLIGWDSDGDGLADEGYKHVKKNLTIKAVFRDKLYFDVNFYAVDGEICSTVNVKEGCAVDLSKVSYDPIVGQIFKQWKNADKDNSTTLENVRSNADFVAEFAKIDSVIPMVAKNTITVDGKKDPAYLSGAYLPVNEERHADRAESTFSSADAQAARPQNQGDLIPNTEIASSWTTTDAWLVWDGDYIYVMIEVADKTLTYRNPKYVQLNANAWLNDNIECYFNFEQASTSEKNKKKLGMDALGQKLFANSIAVYGSNSTHYAEMEGAARSALGYFKNGAQIGYDTTDNLTNDKALLESTDDVRVQYAETLNDQKYYSHRIELKLPAWTEGVPDTENYPVDENGRLPAGTLLEEGVMAGTEVPELTNPNDASQVLMDYYRFTSGEKLQVGSFVRFVLQINDLMVSLEDMLDPTSGYYEGDPSEMQVGDTFLYKIAGDRTSMFYPPFVPSGHTQYDLSGYVAFSLGGEGDAAKWEVYELTGKEIDGQMRDKDGNVIVQGSETITVKTTK